MPELAALLDDRSAWVREGAIRGLLEYDDPELTGHFYRAVGDPDEKVRRAVIEALARIGNPSAVSVLQAALPHLRKRRGDEEGEHLPALDALKSIAQRYPKAAAGDVVDAIRQLWTVDPEGRSAYERALKELAPLVGGHFPAPSSGPGDERALPMPSGEPTNNGPELPIPHQTDLGSG